MGPVVCLADSYKGWILSGHAAMIPMGNGWGWALVVEDQTVMRRMIRNVLMNYGFSNVVGVDNGNAALEHLRSKDGQRIRLVVCDFHMPVMNGLEFLRELRRSPIFGKIPFLMVSDEARRDCIVEVLTAGANSYVIKPFSTETLYWHLEFVLSGSGKKKNKQDAIASTQAI